ncbi:MAG: DUF815 domain-containing protein, partial [Alphaproteobacteria bacterium]|nr:DUF815 domain-containing protein [Alphaproteobacteria bacterium]
MVADDVLRELNGKLDRLLALVARAVPAEVPATGLDDAEAFVWHAEGAWLQPVQRVNRVELPLLKGIDRVRDILEENTLRFANGVAANNALLWGARGMGKSSLVKAVHASVNASGARHPLKLIEIHREDIDSLPVLLNRIRDRNERVILFCDDLSFDTD